MQKIQNQSHDKSAFIYALSKMFERAGYYGMRALVVLYMIGESLKMSHAEALGLYGIFTTAILLSGIIGAVFGDLIMGNKRAIIVGGLIQAIGIFCLCISSKTGLYVGLILIVIGSGFYGPNMLAAFGKLYLKKTKLLDAGFSLFYMAINIGAAAGAGIIAVVGEKLGWSYGFTLAAVLMLLATGIPIFVKTKTQEETIKVNSSIGKRAGAIIAVTLLSGLFWAIYEVSGYAMYDLGSRISQVITFELPSSIISSLNTMFIIPLSIAAVVIWSFFYYSQFVKLTIGFLFAALAFSLLFLIPETPTNQHVVLYLVSILSLTIAELHIAPIVLSVVTLNTNPKYLAIIVSLLYLPGRAFSVIVALFTETFTEDPSLALKFSMIAMLVISAGIVGYIMLGKKPSLSDSQVS